MLMYSCALTVYLHLFLMALKMNLSISFYSQFGFVCVHIEMWEDYLTKCKSFVCKIGDNLDK